MKKLLMIGTLCFVMVLLGTSAFADFEICGTCAYDKVVIYAGEQIPCDVNFRFFINGETFWLKATAAGDLLCGAILKAFNAPEPTSCTLQVNPFDQKGFVISIIKVDFPAID